MLKLSAPNIGSEEIQAVTDVLFSGNLVQGKKVLEFEADIAKYSGAKYVTAVSSGTAALYLSLVASGVKAGDAVVVPGFTFPATANAVVECGAVPVMADVDLNTCCITVESIKDAVENWSGPEKIVGVIPVHEFGVPAPMKAIVEYAKSKDLFVIEDAACAIGASIDGKHVGTFGDFGCFSFHPRKIITTGEGGAILTNNYKLDSKLKMLRNHGIGRGDNGNTGFFCCSLNFRLTDIQAAIGISQLKKLPKIMDARAVLAEIYDSKLKFFSGVEVPGFFNGRSWQTYFVRLTGSDKINLSTLIESFGSLGVEVNIGAHSLLKLDSFSHLQSSQIFTHNSDCLYKAGLALPFCESYTEDDVESVVKCLNQIVCS